MNDPWGRTAEEREQQRDAFRRYFMLMLVVLAALAIGALIKWGYNVYYVDTHCTSTILGRVCQ